MPVIPCYAGTGKGMRHSMHQAERYTLFRFATRARPRSIKKLVANRRVGWRQSASTCVRLGIANPPHMITQVSIGGLVIDNWFSTWHPTDTPTHPTPDSQGMAASAHDARFFVNPQCQTTTLLLSNLIQHLLPGQSFRAHGKAGNRRREHAREA